MHGHAVRVLVDLEAAATAIDANAQHAVGQACAGDGGIGALVLDPVMSAVAVRDQRQARTPVHEREVPLAGMAKAPAIGDRPGGMRIR